MIQEILDATTKRTKIKIDYVDREGERTTRVIRPYHAFKWHSNTYFMGFCEFDNDIRTFKISRIKKLEVLNQFSDKILSLREYEALGHFSYFRRYPIRELKAAPQPRRQLDMPSTPYNVSSENIDFSQREPYRFTSDSTYPKEHYSPKLVNNPATCRSPIEEEIFTILDTDSKVRSYWIEAIRIPYIVGTEQHTYTPDILVEYTNGKKILVEIKASHDIDSVLNEMKFRAAELYCEEQGIRFQIWTLERGELKVFPSWQEAVSSERQVNVIDTYAMIRHPAKPPAYDAQQNVVYKSQREAEQQTHEQYQKRKASEQEKQESTVKNTVYCYMPEAVRFVQRCWWAYIIIFTIGFLGLFAAILVSEININPILFSSISSGFIIIGVIMKIGIYHRYTWAWYAQIVCCIFMASSVILFPLSRDIYFKWCEPDIKKWFGVSLKIK